MKTYIITIIIFFIATTLGKSQQNVLQNTDSVKIDSILNNIANSAAIDSGLFKDTSNIKIKDSLYTDSINYTMPDLIDTTKIDSLKKDSVILFMSPVEFSKYYLNNTLLKDTTKIISDTVKNAVSNLIQYLELQNIDSSISTLQISVLKDSNLFIKYDSLGVADSSGFLKRDTVFNAIQLLINKILDDSTKLSITNKYNDSLNIWLKRDSTYNYRFRLFDDNKEIAGIQIFIKDINNINLSLEPGTQLKKIEKRSIIEPSLPISISTQEPLTLKEEVINIGIWDIYGVGTMSFSQGYVSNWVKGGQSSISTLTVLKFNANYSRLNTRWDNDAEIKLGALGLFDKEDIDHPIRKNEDIFILNSKFGQKAFNNVYYTLLGNMQTQFLKGYEYPRPDTSVLVSEFLSPGQMIFSFGLDYKPSNNFTLMVSPLTSKFTLVIDTSGIKDHTKYGLEQDEKLKKEFGGYIKSSWKESINENIDLENRFNLFMNYSDIFNQEKNHSKIPDIDWEFMLNFKVSRYVVTSINTHLIYDFDVQFPVLDENGDETGETTDKVQFKEYFNIGFSYRF